VHEQMDLDYAIDFANFHDADNWHAPRAERAVDLLKVHGSLNWLYCPVCKAMWLTPKRKGVIALISGRGRRTICKSCEGRYVPVLIPPTYFKVMSNPHLIAVWEQAERHLRRCERIIFCGYSLPDADIHIKYLLKRGQLNRGDHQLTATVVNSFPSKDRRTCDDERERYTRLFGADAVTYTGASFEDFACNPEAFIE